MKPSDSFHSSLTHRKYVIKCDDKNINTLNCSTSNCIYLITCCRCGLQYVGETVQSLRDRFSGHRAGMKNPFADNRCKILSKHFSVGLCKNANYIVNIIEKLSGSGRDDNGNPIPGVTVERQKKETKWMLTLQTVYPYGLNDRVGDEYMAEKDSRVVGNKFLPLHRLYKRPEYNYSKNKLDNSFLKQNFVKILTTPLDHNLKDAGYFIRVSIKSFKKSFLKHICNDVYDFLSNKADLFPNQQWYEMTLDLIESRIYNPPAPKTTKTKPKNLIKLHFVNKGMDMINISKIINNKNVKKSLPTQFNKTEQISTVYTLTKTIRSKIFNHKEFIKTLDTKDILKNMNKLPCNCTTSPFTDANHGHIVSGDIRIVQNNKLRKLLCKSPKYREPVSINFSKCKTEIKNSLTKFSSDWCNRKGVSVTCFTQWISIVMEKVNKKIEELKNKFKFSRVKKVLRDPEVVSYLNILQKQYVMCPIDKAANNIAFICKKYYVQVLIKELGLFSATSNTYQEVNDTLHNILQQQNNTLDSVFGLKNNDEEFNCLPCIYWLPKMHKIPSGARFIIAGKKCINKQLSKHVISAFKLCYSQIDAYHKKTYYFSGVKTFWVIQNNSLPLECIKKINKRKNAKQISTFDFSTLYTKIPHDKLLDILHKVVDFVFKRGTRDYIIINKQGCASWSSKKRGHHFVFTKSLLKEAIKFLLHNCFFSIGNITMIQVIGIPMGSDPAPFFANLFLAHKEADWVKAQRKLGTINVRKINNSFRFIDDLLSLNDGSTFEKHYKDIYPTELELKKENNSNSCASFLDLYIYIENGEFHTRLFDKRDNFGFDIVRMPFYCSNVPSKMFYGSIGAEFLRISRATSKIEDLTRNCKQLLSRMLKQNGQMRRIKFSLIKMIQRHREVFIKYNKSIEEVMQAIGF